MHCGAHGRCCPRTFDAFSGVSKSDHTSWVSASLSLPSFSTLNRQKPADDSKSSSILGQGRVGGAGVGGRRQGPRLLLRRGAFVQSTIPALRHGLKGCRGAWHAGRSHAVRLQVPCIPPAPGPGIPQAASLSSTSWACLQAGRRPQAAAPGVLLRGVASSAAECDCSFPSLWM